MAVPSREHIVNGETLCRIVGITHVTLRAWEGISDFPPFRKGSRGVSSQYDSVKVLRWWARRFGEPTTEEKVRLDEAERRKLVAEAELKELQLAQKRGELVSAEDMTAAHSKAWGNAKARLLTIPSAVAPIAVTLTPAEVEALLRERITQAMQDVADNPFPDEHEPSQTDSSERDPDVPAAPATDDQPVGRRRKGAKPRGKQRARKVAH